MCRLRLPKCASVPRLHLSSAALPNPPTHTSTSPPTKQVSKFRVQAIREDGLIVEEARELALPSGVAASADGLQLEFAWPSGEPQRLKFRLAATDSTFAGPWSAETNTVTVGEFW